MSNFMDKAKKLASEHPDLVNKGLEKAGQLAEEKTGGRFDSQIEAAEQQAEGYLGTDNQGSNQGNNNQGN
jgi:hypothetical protein